jgi:exodeoxyribonuclease V alpha subunit
MLKTLYGAGYFSSLDYFMAEAAGRVSKETDSLVLLAMAVASRFTSQGHVCVDLAHLSQTPVVAESGEAIQGVKWPDAEHWLSALKKSPLVAICAAHAPLVIDQSGRLYLARYWQYQQRLLFQLRQRSFSPVEAVDSTLLEKGLDHLFPVEKDEVEPNGQRLAAQTSVRRQLTVVSGGPGTGKTYTVVKILMLIIAQALSAGSKLPSILLAAPTGKAAARLKESISAAKAALVESTFGGGRLLIAGIPDEATTIHRLLGKHPHTDRFRHGAENPLPVDVLLVDEASMVDLSLMTKLLEAVPFSARVILLGDENQLASVEAGAILGDICLGAADADQGPDGTPKPEGLSEMPRGSKIKDCIVRLTRSYRFDEKSGIGNLASAIRNGDAEGAIALLTDPDDGTVEQISFADGGANPTALETILMPHVRTYYLPYLEELKNEKRLQNLNRFRILCAHRRGMTGVEPVNLAVERMLQEETGLRTDQPWYSGRPIMMLQNDYQLGLFNGDVGMISSSEQDGDKWMAYFSITKGGVRAVSPTRLSAHETVFAMTVHKSQGSEFDHVLVVLPVYRSPVVTRELLYTAVTRAKKSVTVLGSEEVIRGAIKTPVHRSSGLSEQLRGE